MMKFWMYENNICELRSEELNEGWSLQLYTQLLQLRKESLNKPELPYLWYIVVLLPQKRFFERSFILSSLFTVPNSRRNIRDSKR